MQDKGFKTKPRIYKAVSKTTGLSYIGQTRYTLKRRQTQHYDRAFVKHRMTRFAIAIRTYGSEDFIWETLQEVEIEGRTPQEIQEELNQLEKFYIAKYDSFNNGYNMNEGGSGCLKYKYGTWEEKYAANRANHIRRRKENKEEHNADQMRRKRELYEKFPEKKEHNKEKHSEYMKKRMSSPEGKAKRKAQKLARQLKAQQENKEDVN